MHFCCTEREREREREILAICCGCSCRFFFFFPDLAIHFPLRGCRELDSLLRLRHFDFDRIASCACSIASPHHSRYVRIPRFVVCTISPLRFFLEIVFLLSSSLTIRFFRLPFGWTSLDFNLLDSNLKKQIFRTPCPC
jgi:hypothetical protein